MSRKETIVSLVKKAKDGDDLAFNLLLEMLEPQIKCQCKKFYLPGGDSEDILQEARIGLYKAVQDYNNESFDTNFENFALRICIRRRLITIISSAQRGKAEPLNKSYSLDMPIISDKNETSGQTIGDLVIDENAEPSKQLIEQERLLLIKNVLYAKLTDLEAKVLQEYELESSYKEIAEALDISEKCVDNSLMRIRKKAKECDI